MRKCLFSWKKRRLLVRLLMSSFNWVFFDLFYFNSHVRSVDSKKEKRRFFLYSLYAWGVPAIIVIVGQILDNVRGLPDWVVKPQFGLLKCFFSGKTRNQFNFHLINWNLFFICSSWFIFCLPVRTDKCPVAGEPLLFCCIISNLVCEGSGSISPPAARKERVLLLLKPPLHTQWCVEVQVLRHPRPVLRDGGDLDHRSDFVHLWGSVLPVDTAGHS